MNGIKDEKTSKIREQQLTGRSLANVFETCTVAVRHLGLLESRTHILPFLAEVGFGVLAEFRSILAARMPVAQDALDTFAKLLPQEKA